MILRLAWTADRWHTFAVLNGPGSEVNPTRDMKGAAWKNRIAVLVVLLGAVFVESTRASPPPQPRPRLQRDGSGTATAVEQKSADVSGSATTLEKMTVTDTKVHTRPKPLEEYDGDKFSFSKGGPVYQKSGKRSTVLVGLWNHPDVFAEDARFTGQQTHGMFDLLRIKW